MVELTAHCIKCGIDTGIKALHFDTSWNIIVVRLTCGHTVKVETVFKFLTQKDLDELFPDPGNKGEAS